MTNDQVPHCALNTILSERSAWGQLGARGAVEEGDGLGA